MSNGKTDSNPEALARLEPIETYSAEIRNRAPWIEEGNDVAARLATLYRAIDYHAFVLEVDPGNRASTMEFRQLAKLALQHEEALGIETPKGSGGTLPSPIRRS